MPIDLAHAGRSRLLNAREHNSMAQAVNYVEANAHLYDNTRPAKHHNEFVYVYATTYIRAGTAVELGGAIVDITQDYPHAPTDYGSWLTVGQTQSTGILQNNRAVYGRSPIQNTENDSSGTAIWDSGRGVYGIANSAINKGDIGKVQTAGIAAARIRFDSDDDIIAFPGTTNLVGSGFNGVLQSVIAGRAGMLICGKPTTITTEANYTWAYVLIGSFISPYATRVRAKIASDFDESDTTVSIKDLVPYDGVLPTAWKVPSYRGTVQNQMQFKGSTNFYCDVAYNVQQNQWQLTGVQC